MFQKDLIYAFLREQKLSIVVWFRTTPVIKTSQTFFPQVDAGAAIKACLQKEIKKACMTAMKVNTPEFERRMEMIVINNDASNTVISVNSLNFQIMVSDLTEEVITLFYSKKFQFKLFYL